MLKIKKNLVKKINNKKKPNKNKNSEEPKTAPSSLVILHKATNIISLFIFHLVKINNSVFLCFISLI